MVRRKYYRSLSCLHGPRYAQTSETCPLLISRAQSKTSISLLLEMAIIVRRKKSSSLACDREAWGEKSLIRPTN